MNHLRSDIALLQLDRPALLSEKVNSVCLPPKGSRVAAGTRCFVTGILSYKARADDVIVHFLGEIDVQKLQNVCVTNH